MMPPCSIDIMALKINVLLIYVDDIIITESLSLQIIQFISQLSLAFNMKDLSNLHYCLGIQVAQDTSTITLTQTRYVFSFLHKFALAGVSTPLASRSQLFAAQGVPLHDPTIYWQLFGSLQYLTLTRLGKSCLSIYAKFLCFSFHCYKTDILLFERDSKPWIEF